MHCYIMNVCILQSSATSPQAFLVTKQSQLFLQCTVVLLLDQFQLNISQPEQLRSRGFLRSHCVGEIYLETPLDLESFHRLEYICFDMKKLLEITKTLTAHHTANSARLLCWQQIVGGFCFRFQLLGARFRHWQLVNRMDRNVQM